MNAIVLCLCLIVPSNSDVETEWLRVQMQSGRKEIATAKIEFHRFNGGGGASMSAADLEAALEEYDLSSGDLDQFHSLAKFYFGEDFSAQKLSTMKSRFVLDGIKTREELFSSVQVFDGHNSVLSDHRARQASLGLAGGVGMRRLGIQDFRVLFSPDGAQKMKFIGIEDGVKKFTANNGHLDLEVDQDVGLVRHMRFFDSENRAERDIWQFGRIEHSEISMPQCILQVRYAKGRTKRVDAIMLTDIEINGEIAPTEFTQPVDKGITVVDFRENVHHPRVAIVGQPSQNVVAGFVPTKATLFSTTPPNTGGNWFLIAGNAVALLIIAAVFLLMRRKTC